MNHQGAIVLLGAQNDRTGNLSRMALERCNKAFQVHTCRQDFKVLPTGGWGDHFNTTDKPHAYYLKQYLVTKGIPQFLFLECAESSNSIEDARCCRQIVDRHDITDMIVVTSDFHLERARFLFAKQFPDKRLSFSTSKTHLPKEELNRRRQHEKEALQKLQDRRSVQSVRLSRADRTERR
jgi:uncharacterized SAM-binding protein YcdF (DUF218 family)